MAELFSNINTILGIVLFLTAVAEMITLKILMPKLAAVPNADPKTVNIIQKAVAGMAVLTLIASITLLLLKPL